MEIFDVLDSFTKNKAIYPENNIEFQKNYVPYVINRWISSTELFVPLVNAINRYDIPKKNHYEYYLASLPQRKYYFKYPKSNKNTNNENKRYVTQFLECGSRDYDAIIECGNENIIDEIVKKYEVGGKE